MPGEHLDLLALERALPCRPARQVQRCEQAVVATIAIEALRWMFYRTVN
jgi:hypothetical protein